MHMEPPVSYPLSQNQDLRTALWVFLAAFLFFAVVAPMGQIPSDTECSILTAQAMVHHRSLALKQEDRFWYFARTTSGQLHSQFGIGYAASFVPQVVIAAGLSKFVPQDPTYVLEFVVSFTNTFYAAIIAALFFLLFVRLGHTRAHALTGTLLISCASILLPYSKIIHAEIPTTLCLMLFFLELSGGNTRAPSAEGPSANGRALDVRRGAALGAIVSALYLLKIGNVPLAGIVGSYALVCVARRRYTPAGLCVFSALAVLPFCGLLLMNKRYFGTFFNFGYGTEQLQFSTPVLHGIAGFLFSPSKSIFVFSPLLVMSAAGLRRFTKGHPAVAWYALAIMIVDLIFYSMWHDWNGGWCWGPRLIIPAVIIGHVFCIEVIASVRKSVLTRAAMVFLVCFAISINMLGALVWYQQIFYFHRDYTSVRYSHPAIAARLLVHKLEGKPEIYTCADLGADCTRPAYHAAWNDLITGDTIDFRSFEKFRGLATMWTGIADNFSWKWVLVVPVLLFAGSLACVRRLRGLTRGS
jgi:hypothetical protein